MTNSTEPQATPRPARRRWRVTGQVYISQPLDVLVYARTREHAEEAASSIGWSTHDHIVEVNVETCVEEPDVRPTILGKATLPVWVLMISDDDGVHIWTRPSRAEAKATAAEYIRQVWDGADQIAQTSDDVLIGAYFADRVGNLRQMDIRECQFPVEPGQGAE